MHQQSSKIRKVRQSVALLAPQRTNNCNKRYQVHLDVLYCHLVSVKQIYIISWFVSKLILISIDNKSLYYFYSITDGLISADIIWEHAAPTQVKGWVNSNLLIK